VGTEPTRDGRQNTAAPRRATRRDRRPGATQAILPEADMAFFHRRQVGVDLRQARIGLAGRHRAVLRRAVDLVLPVLAVSASVRRLTHGGPDHTTLFAPRANLR